MKSRQLEYQHRHKAIGLCKQCSEPVADGLVHCLKHAIQRRNECAMRTKAKRKYNCASRRLERKAAA